MLQRTLTKTTASRLRGRLLGLACGLVLAQSCRIADPEHCLHKASQPDAWCAETWPEAPYCSPCLASSDHNGCVPAQPDPDVRPDYEPDDATTDAAP